MSLRDFERFAEMLGRESPDLEGELGTRLRDAVSNSDIEGVISLGKENKLDFDVDDILAFHEKHNVGRLTDQDLEGVAGRGLKGESVQNVGAVTAAVVYAVMTPTGEVVVASAGRARRVAREADLEQVRKRGKRRDRKRGPTRRR